MNLSKNLSAKCETPCRYNVIFPGGEAVRMIKYEPCSHLNNLGELNLALILNKF